MNCCRLRLVRKAFGGRTVLADLELDLPAGSFTAIVGPSGAGKSTLLNLLGGLDADFDGRLTWGDGARATLGAAGRIGYCFQDPRLMPWMTLQRNLELVLSSGSGARERVRELLRRVGLAGREADFPGALSGGMQRRAALARAMVVQPSLLLLDEPFASLDAPTAADLRHLLLELWRSERPAVVLVTHDLSEALQLADEVLFLSSDPGRIVHRESLSPSRLDPRVARDAQHLAVDLLQRHPELLSGVPAPHHAQGRSSA
jgi:ABC-type nitrate/sulfonate/bicarbonate transport system ATPase subunit